MDKALWDRFQKFAGWNPGVPFEIIVSELEDEDAVNGGYEWLREGPKDFTYSDGVTYNVKDSLPEDTPIEPRDERIEQDDETIEEEASE